MIRAAAGHAMTAGQEGGPASGSETLHRAEGLEAQRGEGSWASKSKHPWSKWLRLDWSPGGSRAIAPDGSTLAVNRIGGPHDGTLIRYRWTVTRPDGERISDEAMSPLQAMKDAESVALEGAS